MKINCKKTVMSVVLLLTATASQGQQLPYMNPSLSAEERATDLLSRMTIEEKVAQLQCMWIDKRNVFTDGKFDETKAAELLKDGLGHWARPAEDWSIASLEDFGKTFPPREAAEQYNAIQRYFVEKTRLGIPIAAHDEILHGLLSRYGTHFPMPIALASSWDEALMHDIYTVVAKEMRARGGTHALGPVVDVLRDPRWGRTEETMGEDPCLISRMGVAIVDALQGGSNIIDTEHVGVTLKHFGVHGASEGGVNTAPSHMDEHETRSTFLIPFRECIRKAKPLYVMATYNDLWGMPAHANHHLLTDILRDEFGFDGAVVSDYSAISNVVTQNHSSPTIGEAAARTLKAGTDVDLPSIGNYLTLKQDLDEGKVTEDDINQAVYRVLLCKFRMGLFEHPYIEDVDAADAIVGCEAHRQLAYKAASESMVLLQNENHLLPLDENEIKTIALVGPNADCCILGGYSDVPRDAITPLRAIREKYGDKMEILYAEGVRLTERRYNAHLLTLEENAERIEEAVTVAKKADVILLFLGENDVMRREGTDPQFLGDLPTLELQAGQKELVSRIVALGKPVCAMINSGTTLSLGELEKQVPAVMQCWYLGQEGGYAMIDAVFGDINPSGKLAISFPRSVGHIPAYYNYKPSSRRGYNLDMDVTPLHPFGYGLSYTTYAYSNLTIDRDSISEGEKAIVRIEVENTGDRSGDEIVQLYITDDYSTMTRPVKELKDFRRISLAPGEKKTVTFEVDTETLSSYDENNQWMCEPGTFTIAVGASSEADQKVTLCVRDGLNLSYTYMQ